MITILEISADWRTAALAEAANNVAANIATVDDGNITFLLHPCFKVPMGKWN